MSPHVAIRSMTVPVRAIALSQDGSSLAYTMPHNFSVWNLKAGELLYVKNDDKTEVNALSFSYDGTLLFSAHSDGQVKVWHVPTGRMLASLKHTFGVVCLSVTPDSRLLLTGTEEGKIHLWESDPWHKKLELTGHRYNTTSVDITPDGKRGLSGAADQTLKYWDLEKGVLIRQLEAGVKGNRAHVGILTGVRIMPDGKHAISTAHWEGTTFIIRSGQRLIGDYAVRLWCLDSGQVLKQTNFEFGALGMAGNISEHEILIIQLAGFGFCGWLASLNENTLDTTRLPSNICATCTASQRQGVIAIGTMEGKIILWNYSKSSIVAEMAAGNKGGVVISPEGRYEVFGEYDKLEFRLNGKPVKESAVAPLFRTKGLLRQLLAP